MKIINYYKGNLDLSNPNVTLLPEGLVVDGSLGLKGTNITTLPEGLVVGRWLNLKGTNISALPDGLVVGGWLDLKGTNISSLPEGLVVGGSLDLKGTNITTLPAGLTVGGALDLEGTNISSLPEGLVVGGSLDLKSVSLLSGGLLAGGLMMGGWLNLKGTDISSLPNDLMVNGDVYADFRVEKTKRISQYEVEKKLVWKNGKYRIFDKIFCEVISKKGSVYKVKIEDSVAYVIDGGDCYSHGRTIKEARESLIYKRTTKDLSEFSGLTIDSIVSFDDAVKLYRSVTGACAYGTEQFIKESNIKNRKYSIREILARTKGYYGWERLAKFFSLI